MAMWAQGGEGWVMDRVTDIASNDYETHDEQQYMQLGTGLVVSPQTNAANVSKDVNILKLKASNMLVCEPNIALMCLVCTHELNKPCLFSS